MRTRFAFGFLGSIVYAGEEEEEDEEEGVFSTPVSNFHEDLSSARSFRERSTATWAVFSTTAAQR